MQHSKTKFPQLKLMGQAYILGKIFNAEGDNISTGEDLGDKQYEAAITEGMQSFLADI